MTRTGSIVATTLLIVLLAAAGKAQTPAPPPTASPAITQPLDRSELRHQIYVMEGALVRAVSFGAQRLTREIRSVVPEMMTVSGEPQARGVYLEGYGVFFDVGVPILHQSMVWSLRTMLGQDDKGLLDALNVLKEQAKEARTPAGRLAIENAIARLELQLGPLNNTASLPELKFPSPAAGDKGVGAAMVAGEPSAATAPEAATPPPSPAPTIDRKYLQDPNAINRAYTTSVQNALIDAMIAYSLPMALGPDEFLTVGARDNMPRDTLAPPDPYEEVVTVLLRIKGSDLAAYRSGQIDRVEVKKRVQVREF
jgi:hypothetical protein